MKVLKELVQVFVLVTLGVILVVYLKTGSLTFIKTFVTRSASRATEINSPQDLKDALTGAGGALKREIFNPGPLISKLQAANVNLTHDGVVSLTNTQRADVSSLPALAVNARLDQIARERLNDMFAKQYFEHINPQGIGAADLAKDDGYDYIVIGENIALGNFANDQVLVQAWMDSPGHRANILNSRYQEIGVAVGKGVYEGRTTWIGVQVFGKPATSCPTLDANLKSLITVQEGEVDRMKASLDSLQSQMSSMRSQGNFNRDSYNQLAAKYNAGVTQYNSELSSLKARISKYNVDVRAYNACIAK